MTVNKYRKSAAYFFLFLLLFNALGYYLLLGYQQIQNRQIMLEEMPTTSFKVVKMLVSPYAHIEDRDFEYVSGSFYQDGKAYDFVKKRIKNDTLEYYCLNNVHQDALISQLNDYLKENVINGKDAPNQSIKWILKAFYKEYIPCSKHYLSLASASSNMRSCELPIFKDIESKAHLSVLFSPPDLA
ncbi:MAG: hypothetical protein JNL70_21480 [Saprospiraceae bacterium]|nr:hypothetical protein [Saprospiraceae bacterium]